MFAKNYIFYFEKGWNSLCFLLYLICKINVLQLVELLVTLCERYQFNSKRSTYITVSWALFILIMVKGNDVVISFYLLQNISSFWKQ